MSDHPEQGPGTTGGEPAARPTYVYHRENVDRYFQANMEMEAYDAGYVRKLLIPEGGAAPVGAPIAILTEEPDEDIAEELGRLQSGVQAAPSDPKLVKAWMAEVDTLAQRLTVVNHV